GKISRLSTNGRPEVVRIMDWLSANGVKPGDTLVLCGDLAYYQEPHRTTPIDQFFAEWHRRLRPSVITEMQLEVTGRFDVRKAASPAEVATLLTPHAYLITATRMAGLHLVSHQHPLYLYTRDTLSSETVRPLYIVDPSSG